MNQSKSIRSRRRYDYRLVAAALFGSATAAHAQLTPPSDGDRVLGVDISAWQADMTTTEWATLKRPTNQQVDGVFGDGRDFVFIRSSRGGTTGEDHRQGGYPAGDNTFHSLSNRYDDPYYIRNITRATAAGMYAGSYHFGRADVIETTQNSGGIANNGTDEANHFLQMAGPFMRPGYLPPIFDLEAGINERSSQDLAQFTLDFGNRIYEAKGIRPGVYINGSYAADMQAANQATREGLVNAYPTLWPARWPNQADPNSINVQTTHPSDTVAHIYGPWDDAPGTVNPWQFWQYASTMRLNGNNLGGSNTDVNVVHGGMEYLKDQLIPAVWMNDSSGNWATLANWNSGEEAVAPPVLPGMLPRVGPLTLPGARLPGRPDPNNAVNGTNVLGVDDTVRLDRPGVDITVTFDSSAPATNIRNLILNEQLNVTGSSLTVNRRAVLGATRTMAISGGTVSIAHAVFDAGGTLEVSANGALAISEATFTGASGMGLITALPGAVNPALNLTGGTRTFTVNDGSSPTDLRVQMPLTNGNLVKDGAGTLELAANNTAFAGTINVNLGHLLVTGNNQLGSQGVRTNQTDATIGGSVRVSGNGLSIGAPITLGGLGALGGGALENISGNNTWSGNVKLAGLQSNQNQPGLNQIAAVAGTALTISGVIENNTTSATWAKVGAGDVVLSNTNTYTGLTRVFTGRLIVEKDGALGSAGSNSGSTANTFFLPATSGGAGAIAFRAPAGSPGFDYNTNEWLFLEGAGVNGAQLDNLGGNNTFAGSIAVGGPDVGGTRESYLAVSAGSLEIKGGVHAYPATSPETRNIFKSGPGTLIFSGTGPVTPTNASARQLANSSFTVNAGTVKLAGTLTNGANIPGVTTWNVNGAGSALSLARTGAAGSAAINLNAGTLHTDAASVGVANAVNVGANGAVVDTSGAAASLNLTGALGNAGGNAIQKTGAGTLTLAGTQTHGVGAAFTANAGTTNFNTNAGSAAARNLDVNVAAGATVNFDTAQHLDAVAIAGGNASIANGGNKTLVASGLTITSGGILNVTDNSVVIDYTGASPIATLEGYVRTAFHNGDWLGAGITSTVVQANANFVVAIADNAQLPAPFGTAQGGPTFAGVNVDLTSVLVKFTHRADINLDGSVDPDDSALFGGNYDEGQPARWATGDMNYDGVFTPDDAAIFGGYYDEGLNTLSRANSFAALFDGSVLVPEPSAALALLAAGSITVSARRRRCPAA